MHCTTSIIHIFSFCVLSPPNISFSYEKLSRCKTPGLPRWLPCNRKPHYNHAIPFSSQSWILEFTHTPQLKKRRHQRGPRWCCAWNAWVYFSSVQNKYKKDSIRFLNISLAVSFSLYDITSVQQALDNVLSNLEHPNFKVSFFKEQTESLQPCIDTTKDVGRKKNEEYWTKLIGTKRTFGLKVSLEEHSSTTVYKQGTFR